MTRFDVVASDKKGRTVTCRISAAAASAVYALAEKRGWTIVSVEKKEPLLCFRPKVSSFTYLTSAYLFHQLSIMIQSGVTLVQAWHLLMQDIAHKKQRQRMEEIIKRMESGMILSQAMAQSGLFPSMACHMVKAGENTGNLERIFEILGDYYEYIGKQRRLLINALAYPVFLIICTIGMFTGAVFFILPVFEEMFVQMAVPLPVPTQYILKFVHLTRSYGIFFLMGIAGLTVGVGFFLQKPVRREFLEQQIFSVAYLRRACIIVCWQRFSQLLSMQIASGIPLLQALQEAGAAVPSYWFRSQAAQAARRLENGVSFSKVVQQGRFGTTYIETMLSVGEMTGKYEETLQSVADYYGWRIASWSATVQKLFGPVMLLFVGAMIGLLVLCLLLPLLDMAAGIIS